MVANAAMLFMLSVTVLAIELTMVVLLAVAVVYFVLVRERRMKLGSPGRLRLNITKVVAGFVGIWLCALLFWALVHKAEPQTSCEPTFPLGADVGAWLALVPIGIAVMTSVLIVIVRRRDDRTGEPG
jgi:hypothetical protein